MVFFYFTPICYNFWVEKKVGLTGEIQNAKDKLHQMGHSLFSSFFFVGSGASQIYEHTKYVCVFDVRFIALCPISIMMMI